MKQIIRPFLGFFSAVAGAVLVVAVFHFTLWGKDAPPAFKIESTPVNRDAKFGYSYAPVIKKAAPSVVNIYSSRTVKVSPTRNPFQNDPLFRQFFGDPGDGQPSSRKEEGLGSGVIISVDGYILTANHVVDGMDEIKVGISGDKKEYVAKVIGKDKPTDVAVLKIDANNLPAITLADSEQLEIGDVVLAIGNPFGVGQTVTSGIISALGRSGLGINGNGYENFIQTDAAINPGNSGGALVDAQGRLVGINTAILSRSGGSSGVGFAVPINLARHIVDRLIAGGKVTRGFLGIGLQEITPALAKAFNLPDQNGALVTGFELNSPAEKAGLKSGDVIIAFNGKPVTDVNNLRFLVSDCAPDTQASVKFIRDGATKTVNVTLAENKEFASTQNNSSSTPADSSKVDALDGVEVADLDQNVRRQLGIPRNIQGAIVSDVDPDSNSADAGLQKGDVILEINRSSVADADSAVKLCEKATGDQVLLKVWRRGGNRNATLWISVDNTKKAPKAK
jgi:serine protease Do